MVSVPLFYPNFVRVSRPTSSGSRLNRVKTDYTGCLRHFDHSSPRNEMFIAINNQYYSTPKGSYVFSYPHIYKHLMPSASSYTSFPSNAFFKMLWRRVSLCCRLAVIVSSNLSATLRRLSISSTMRSCSSSIGSGKG